MLPFCYRLLLLDDQGGNRRKPRPDKDKRAKGGAAACYRCYQLLQPSGSTESQTRKG